MSEPFLDGLTLGEEGEDIELQSSEQNRVAATQMVSQARSTLHIFSHDIEPQIYDNDEFVSAVKELAIYSRFTTIQILFRDPTYAIKHGHRLVDLFRRLSSSIELREIHSDFHTLNEAFLVVDGRGVIHRQLASRYEGTANFNAPMRGRELIHTFTQVWEKSQPHPELRRLHL